MIGSLIYDAGVDAIDGLLRKIGYEPVEKAVSVLTRAGYDRAVRQLLRKITVETAGPDQQALKKAAQQLDRDWGNLTPAKRNAVIEAAASSILDVPEIVVPPVSRVVAEESRAVIAAAKRDNVEAHRLEIAPSLDETDEAIAQYAGRAQAHYITDVYGSRATTFEQRARDIVQAGLDAGMGRDDIGDELARQLIGPGMRVSENYWRMVAAVHTTRARSWGTLSSFRDADIERYVIRAAGDEATCDVCDFLDGQEFDTGEAADRYEEVEDSEDPTDVEQLQPWVQQGTDDDGNRVLYVDRGEGREHVARVVQSAEGEKDTRGRYSHAISSSSLQRLGVDSPPFHGSCRCTMEPA